MTLPSVAPFEMSSRVPGRGSRRASPIRPFLSSDSSRTLYGGKCSGFCSLIRLRQDKLETRTARLDRRVDEVAAVRAGERLCDRKAEPGALRRLTRALAAREALEQVRDEVRLDAFAAVLDREPKVSIVLVGPDSHRWIAVPK